MALNLTRIKSEKRVISPTGGFVIFQQVALSSFGWYLGRLQIKHFLHRTARKKTVGNLLQI
jgi:hypothetical protein